MIFQHINFHQQTKSTFVTTLVWHSSNFFHLWNKKNCSCTCFAIGILFLIYRKSFYYRQRRRRYDDEEREKMWDRKKWYRIWYASMWWWWQTPFLFSRFLPNKISHSRVCSSISIWEMKIFFFATRFSIYFTFFRHAHNF